MEATRNNKAISVKNLNFRYTHEKEPLFKNLSFDLEPGSRCLLIGSNGAGKSTLLRILGGTHMVSEDSVQIYGHSAFHDTLYSNQNVSFLGESWSRTVPFVANGVPYSADITVRDMVANRTGVEQERKDHLVQLLDIDLNWRMHEVSDGQRKRVMILLKMLRPFSVLLLDEVTTHLDVISRLDFLNFLKEESEKRGVTIVYATHIFDGMEDWASHMMHLSRGQMIKLGSLGEFHEIDEMRKKGLSAPLLKLIVKWLADEREEERMKHKEKKPHIDMY